MPAVSRLPPEVLGEIFQLSLDGLQQRRDMLAYATDYRSTLSDYPFVFTAVCRSWATVAKSFPRLWSTINILVSIENPRSTSSLECNSGTEWTSALGVRMDVRADDDKDKGIVECFPPLAVIKDWIKLSRGTPLSFSIQPWVKGARPDKHSRGRSDDLRCYSVRTNFLLKSVLARHHSRWQVALLNLPPQSWPSGLLSRCQFPLLQDVTLDVRGSVGDAEAARKKLMHDIPGLVSRSPNLRSFAFTCNSGTELGLVFSIDIFKTTICWEKLSEISVAGWKGVQPSTLLQLLATCQRLHALSVEMGSHWTGRSEGCEDLPRVCAKHLKELHLSGRCSRYDGDLEVLIDRLTAPNLVVCSLPSERPLPVPAETFVSFIKRSNCSLQCLNIYNDRGRPARLEDNAFLPFVEAASATLEILRLDISHRCLDSFMNYLTVQPRSYGPTACPRLRRLKLSCDTPMRRHQSLRALTTMVESRWDPCASSAVTRLEEFDGKINLKCRMRELDMGAIERDVEKLKAFAKNCDSPRMICLRLVRSNFTEETVRANLVDSRQQLRCWHRSFKPICFEDFYIDLSGDNVALSQ